MAHFKIKLPVYLLIGLLCGLVYNPCKAQRNNLQMLNMGDSAVCIAQAKIRFNKTSIYIQRGATYLIKASGQWQDAGFKPTNADGFAGFTKAMKFGNGLKPMPSQNYLKLLARVGACKIPVGAEHRFKAAHSGRLVLIPNDATFFFGNNSGSLQVTVVRVE